MSIDVWLAFSLFCFVTSITPGPNNIMLLASGVNFGFRASIPHILGISSGFLVMVIAAGSGLTELFGRVPRSYTAMRWIGAAYLLYLAWRIARTGTPDIKSGECRIGHPLGFWGAAAFQWVNPKAWFMAVGAFSTYVPQDSRMPLIVGVATLFALINAPCVSVWAAFGAQMRRLLQVRRFQRAFNYAMAALLVATLIPMLGA